MELPHAG
jgi:6-pyruvoyltetrahydropterin/6-carboxytetrahydropterin synthase